MDKNNVIRFILLCSLACLVGASDKNMTVNELANLFRRPGHGESDVFNYLVTDNTFDIHADIVPKGTKTLILALHKTNNVHNINLDILWTFSGLHNFWLTHTNKTSTQCTIYRANLNFRHKQNYYILLRQLHINVRIEVETMNSIIAVIRSSPYLEVVDLAGTWIWQNDGIYNLFTFISTENLKAISLCQTQNIEMATHSNFTLNLTRLLFPVKTQPIQYLDVSFNNLMEITGSISYLMPNLKVFDISYNILLLKFQSSSLFLPANMLYFESLFLHPKLQVTNFNGEGRIFQQQICHNHDFPKRIKRDLDSNFWSVVITVLNDTGMTINDLLNRTKYCEFLQKGIIKFYLTDMPQSTIQAFLDVPCNVWPFLLDVYGGNSCVRGIKFPIAPNLEYIYLNALANWNIYDHRGNELYNNKTYCFGPNKLKTISLNNFGGNTINTEMFNYVTFKGIECLHTLDLSNNNLKFNFTNTFFKSFPNMTELILANNYVSFLLTNSVADIFPKLEKLDISNNNLSHNDVPVSLFRLSITLTEINISKNSLEILDIDVTDLSNNLFINASYNHIQYLGKYLLDSIHNKNISFDLSGNYFTCGCRREEIHTMKLIKSSAINFINSNSYMCFSSIGIKRVQDIDISSHISDCNPSNIITIVISVLMNILVIMITAMGFIGYKFRYRIYTFYFHMKNHFKHSNKNEEYDFDAFVSYAAEDRFWVHDVLVKKLEDEYGLKLCIHYRDFIIGNDIADEIVKHITKSRCFIAVLSDNFISSQWCDCELKVAHRKSLSEEDKFIMIKLKNIACKSDASHLLQNMLDSLVYMEWPEFEQQNTNQVRQECLVSQRQDLFWLKLRNKLYEKPPHSSICNCIPWKTMGYREINAIADSEWNEK